jgi:amino-acid N-acetyltransferase
VTPIFQPAVSESTASTRLRAGGAVVRKAKLPDAVNIFDLVNSLSGDGTLLRRSYAEICENVRDFAVAESEEAEEQSVTAVCLFTRIPDFFFHFGFRVVDRTTLPDKIYKDCQTCPRLYACDEVAMVRGPLPKIAVLGPSRIAQPELVKLQTGTVNPSR